MSTTNSTNKASDRIAYSFAEIANKIGKERTWVYRQVRKGKLRVVKGYGAAMIPASEIDRIFKNEAAANGANQ